jgi:hypothetical protein
LLARVGMVRLWHVVKRSRDACNEEDDI